MTTSFSLEFIGSKLIDVDVQAVMKDIASNKNYLYISGEGTDGNGYELWRTDGTENGTTLVKDINNGSGGSYPYYLTVMEDIATNTNYLYFSAGNGTNGIELWRTDGTTTTLVRDIMTGTGSSNPLGTTASYIIFPHFTVMKDIASNKNYLYFRATDGTTGSELWRSDGTENGTTLVKDIRTDGDSSSPYYLTVMEDIANNKNYLYFRADNGTDGRELWRSDGTESGTTLVKDINTGSGSGSSPSKFTVMKDIASNKNYLYFVADDGTHGHELWRSDGTENGTTLVKDIMTGSEESDLYELVVMKDTETNTNYLYFAASSVENVYNVWRSDGTTEGTIFTATTSLHQGGTEPYHFNVMKDSTTNKNYLYFVESSDSEGNIWSLYRLLITNSSTVSVEPIICFKEGTQILTLDLNTGLDTYKNIENINTGDLVSTYKHGYVPVNIVGYSNLINTSSNSRITDKLYVYKKEDHPELTEDLYMTGGHSVLLDDENITDNQCDKMMKEMGNLYKTDDKTRLMAKLDYRCDTVDDNRQYRVWHICLDHENEWMNYGIYANGMLVESTCERHAQNFLHKKENVVELIKDQCNLTSLLV